MRPDRDGSRDTTFHDVVARFRRTVGAVFSGYWPEVLRAVELLAPLSLFREPGPPSQVSPDRRPSRDRRHPGPVKRPSEQTIESAFLR